MNKVREAKDGRLVVTCARTNINKLQNKLVEVLGNSYKVETNQLKNPAIKIVGLENKYEKDEIVNIIKNQNKIGNENDSLKINHIQFVKRTETYTIFAEVSPVIFHRIMETQRILLNGSVVTYMKT